MGGFDNTSDKLSKSAGGRVNAPVGFGVAPAADSAITTGGYTYSLFSNTGALYNKVSIYTGANFYANGFLQLYGGICKFGSSATSSPEARSLDDYQEGAYTPTDTSGAGLVFAAATGFFTKIGDTVTVSGYVTYPVTANGAVARISLPYTAAPSIHQFGVAGVATVGALAGQVVAGTNTMAVTDFATMTSKTNVQLSAKVVYFSVTYKVA